MRPFTALIKDQITRMLFSNEEMRNLIIGDTLRYLGSWSPAMEILLLGTAAQESGCGEHLKTGRLLGIYQISAATHRKIWDKFLIQHPELASQVRGLASQRGFLENPHAELVSNLRYATAIAWLIYERCGKRLPQDATLEELATFWHRHFHAKARGSEEDFIRNYKMWVSGEKSLAA